jgi:hypothetical protein
MTTEMSSDICCKIRPARRLSRGCRKELDKALLALRIRGYDREDLLVVEFCDTSDADGIFRKYAAFRVGNAIIPVTS